MYIYIIEVYNTLLWKPQFLMFFLENHFHWWNEMNVVSGHVCAHIGSAGPGEPPEDGEIIEMTLSSRHRTRNSRPRGLRPSTLPLGHGGSPQYWLSHVDGEETVFESFESFWKFLKGSGANHYPRAPALQIYNTVFWKPQFLMFFLENHFHWCNEMNGVSGHPCAHIGWTGPGETPGDGEINEITLPSRHRIQNSSPGSMRPSMLPLCLSHNIESLRMSGEETFCFFET